MPRCLTPEAFKRNIIEALGHRDRLDQPRSDSGGEPSSYSVLEVEPTPSPRARSAGTPQSLVVFTIAVPASCILPVWGRANSRLSNVDVSDALAGTSAPSPPVAPARHTGIIAALPNSATHSAASLGMQGAFAADDTPMHDHTLALLTELDLRQFDEVWITAPLNSEGDEARTIKLTHGRPPSVTSCAL